MGEVGGRGGWERWVGKVGGRGGWKTRGWKMKNEINSGVNGSGCIWNRMDKRVR